LAVLHGSSLIEKMTNGMSEELNKLRAKIDEVSTG
jgi:hypothetical protein